MWRWCHPRSPDHLSDHLALWSPCTAEFFPTTTTTSQVQNTTCLRSQVLCLGTLATIFCVCWRWGRAPHQLEPILPWKGELGPELQDQGRGQFLETSESPLGPRVYSWVVP